MMSSLMPQHAPGFASSSSSPFVSTPTRKRQATADTTTPPSSTKRHKPNLAHGFQGLSLGQLDPLSTHLYSGDESDGTDDTAASLPASELAVEEVDATSSISSSDDSDATFRNTRPQPRRRRAPQQPDAVEDPPEVDIDQPDPDVQDVSTPLRSRKRREHDGDGVEATRNVKRRREGDMDLDDEIEEIPRPSVRSRTRTRWYEPEKDRIVITSLGSPDSSRSSSRSTSPDSRHLSQPGIQGFTLHPSLLTHLLNTQRESLHPMSLPKEHSVVLYRPLGLREDGNVVKEWNGEPFSYDSERFEEVEDEEATMEDEPAAGEEAGEEDSAMDVD